MVLVACTNKTGITYAWLAVAVLLVLCCPYVGMALCHMAADCLHDSCRCGNAPCSLLAVVGLPKTKLAMLKKACAWLAGAGRDCLACTVQAGRLHCLNFGMAVRLHGC